MSEKVVAPYGKLSADTEQSLFIAMNYQIIALIFT